MNEKVKFDMHELSDSPISNQQREHSQLRIVVRVPHTQEQERRGVDASLVVWVEETQALFSDDFVAVRFVSKGFSQLFVKQKSHFWKKEAREREG